MMEFHTFRSLMYLLKTYNDGLDKFDKALGIQINDGWMVQSIDNLIKTIAGGFFSYALYDSVEAGIESQLETIEQLICHYCFMGDFGENDEQLDRVYVENQDTENEIVYPCKSLRDVYNIIIRYMDDNNENDIYFDFGTRRNKKG